MKPASESLTSKIASKIGRWAQARSLWYFPVNLGCCGDEVFAAQGPRYDWERFGCRAVEDPARADLLIVSGPVNALAGRWLQKLFAEMRGPKFVVAVGSCATTGGLFRNQEESGSLGDRSVSGIDQYLPVSVYVAGCPPRPEAILHGILELQRQIREGHESRTMVQRASART